jgi:DNA modification methylase
VSVRILTGDCRALLANLDAESVQTCVTSPPYWGLRDYGTDPLIFGGDPACTHEWGAEGKLHKGGPHGDGVLVEGGRGVIAAQAAVKDIPTGAFCALCDAWRGHLGLEPTPELYVEHIVEVFDAVHRVLKQDGTLWLNLGDSYAGTGGYSPNAPSNVARRARGNHEDGRFGFRVRDHEAKVGTRQRARPSATLKAKDLVGIPWMVAFALRSDGWYLRSDVIWHKPNPMPESVTDRPTKAHEYLFLLAKGERYYYDSDAIAERAERAEEIECAGDTNIHSGESHAGTGKSTRRFKRGSSGNKARKFGDAVGRTNGSGASMGRSVPWEGVTRNKRTVWTVATQPYKGAHFATFPPALIEPCILAGSRRGDTVLDPFGGSGTTGFVADRLERDAVLCELNPTYAALEHHRITRGHARSDVTTEGAAPREHDHGPLFADGAA